MFSTGEQFKNTFKNKVYLKLHELLGSWSQWFITHCDVEPLELTEEEIEQFIIPFMKNVDELSEIDSLAFVSRVSEEEK